MGMVQGYQGKGENDYKVQARKCADQINGLPGTERGETAVREDQSNWKRGLAHLVEFYQGDLMFIWAGGQPSLP